MNAVSKRRLQSIAQQLLTPQYIFVPFVLGGLLFWLLTPAHMMGLRHKSEITLSSAAIVILWYLALVGSAALARSFASGFAFISKRRSSHDYGFYLLLTVLSGLGTFSLIAQIGSIDDVIYAIQTQQVNEVKGTLYQNYSAGFLTLRYTCPLAASVALYRWIALKRHGICEIMNFVFLLICAFVAARILVFQTIIFAALLLSAVATPHFNRAQSSVSGLKVVLLSLILMTMIVVFTYVRSAGTYEQAVGITNPVAVTGLELGTYLAMPVQVAFGVADVMTTSNIVDQIDTRFIFFAPTFLHPEEMRTDHSGGVGLQWYLPYVDVPAALTTNSTLAQAIGFLGYAAFIMVPAVCFIYAYLFHLLWRSNSVEGRLLCASILYAFFELWRGFYFQAGSFWYLNILLIGYLGKEMMFGRMSLRSGRARRRRPRPMPRNREATKRSA